MTKVIHRMYKVHNTLPTQDLLSKEVVSMQKMILRNSFSLGLGQNRTIYIPTCVCTEDDPGQKVQIKKIIHAKNRIIWAEIQVHESRPKYGFFLPVWKRNTSLSLED